MLKIYNTIHIVIKMVKCVSNLEQGSKSVSFTKDELEMILIFISHSNITPQNEVKREFSYEKTEKFYKKIRKIARDIGFRS